MGSRNKKPDYLDALCDPDLPLARRWALELMIRVRLISAAGEPSASTRDIMAEIIEQKSSLCCVNCKKKLNKSGLFCGDFCQQTPRVVRYIRTVAADGRIERADIQQAVGHKWLALTCGGYPTKERKLSKALRQEVLERDGYKCQLCGRRADQIDHINGSSNDPGNLRALCGTCNRKEALKNVRCATQEKQESLRRLFHDLAERIAASAPTRLCDDDETWNKCWSDIMKARRRLHRELIEEEAEDDFEDIDGYLYAAMQKDD